MWVEEGRGFGLKVIGWGEWLGYITHQSVIHSGFVKYAPHIMAPVPGAMYANTAAALTDTQESAVMTSSRGEHRNRGQCKRGGILPYCLLAAYELNIHIPG